MTIKHSMAAESQASKRQKTGDDEQKSDAPASSKPSDLAIAMAIKLTTTGDINVPKHERSESDDEPTIPLKTKLTDEEIKDMLPPGFDKESKKKKKKSKEPAT